MMVEVVVARYLYSTQAGTPLGGKLSGRWRLC